jgi:hypothetical protein
MKSVNKPISACRHCHFYDSEGRRGGYCQQLSVPVQGSWKACSLAVSPFAKWDQLAGIVAWQPVGTDPKTGLEVSGLEVGLSAEHSLTELAVTPTVLASTSAMIESAIESAFESVLETNIEDVLFKVD